MKLFGGGDDPHRSRGRKASRPDSRFGHGSGRRNPLLVDEDGETASPHHSQREALAPLEAPTQASDQADRRKRHHRPGSHERSSTAKGPLSLSHIAFLLIGLAFGAATLVATQQLYTVLSKSRQETKKEAPIANPASPSVSSVAPTVPKPARLATDPVGAIRLMLQSAAAGDTATAYAQWDLTPDQVATVRRGQVMTVADVVENARAAGERLKPGGLKYKVVTNTGTEARVEQYEQGLTAQIFSLRKRGPHWKLYNVSSP